MPTYSFKRFYSNFNPNELSDDQRDAMVAAIQSLAANSSLVQGNPAMQASVAALGPKAKACQVSRDAATKSQALADADAITANDDRRVVDAELLSFVNLGLACATNPGELVAAGIDLRPAPPPKPPFAPPDQIDITFFKRVKGRFRATAHGFGNRRLNWAVQVCPDPIGSGAWVDAYGDGNSRIITGPSGSKLWVRYAMLRKGQQSDWSTPVLVTIP